MLTWPSVSARWHPYLRLRVMWRTHINVAFDWIGLWTICIMVCCSLDVSAKWVWRRRHGGIALWWSCRFSDGEVITAVWRSLWLSLYGLTGVVMSRSVSSSIVRFHIRHYFPIITTFTAGNRRSWWWWWWGWWWKCKTFLFMPVPFFVTRTPIFRSIFPEKCVTRLI